jgi:hypothetical protein
MLNQSIRGETLSGEEAISDSQSARLVKSSNGGKICLRN